MTRSGPFIHALHLFSPSLPIGAFAFSQGLEAAIDTGHVCDSESLSRWCESVMRFSLTTLDCHYAIAAYRATSDSTFREINAEMLASRETHELLQEDLLLGSAFKKWAVDQGIDLPDAHEYSLICLHGWVAARYELPEEWLVSGILWSWLENQMIVAAKAIPLGQNALQKILAELKPQISECVDQSLESLSMDPSSTVPLLSILSAQHETQYSRLFRS
jgi:urease accessory protein